MAAHIHTTGMDYYNNSFVDEDLWLVKNLGAVKYSRTCENRTFTEVLTEIK
ncbi:MAG: hypothetical protein PHR65_06860 [Syntrophomonadaceae bacterium]|nr:hypothetical protein [Syntrophomonadaceae bacterium]